MTHEQEETNGLGGLCGWESGPDPAHHAHFLRSALELLVDKAVLQSTDRNSRVVEWVQPDDLKKRLHLTLEDDPVTQGDLLKYLDEVIRYSVKTGHPYFINQLFSSLDVYGLVGQWVTDALNPSVYTYEVAPVFTLMEFEVLSEMAKHVGYEEHDGLFSPGGSISNMYGMLLARYYRFPEIKKQGITGLGRLVAFTSIDAHYSVVKSAITLGLGSDNLILVNVDENGRMDVNHLKECITKAREEGGVPFIVCATAGTTVLGAYDPIERVSQVCQIEGLWLHVDAAWGGGALLSPLHKHKLRGIHRADSITWNPHKLLASPQQCSVFLTRHVGLLKDCNSASAAYLFQRDKFYDTSYDTGDKHLQCGRRADVLKFWTMWKAKGTKGLTKHIEKLFTMSKLFADKIRSRDGFTLLLEPECTNVCFWYAPPSLRGHEDNPDYTTRLHAVAPRIKERMVKEGTMMITYQPLRERHNFFRLVLQNSQVNEDDIDYFVRQIEIHGSDL
ncbi:cysteine sulfinic acid decarboxylase-like [Homarus americanus]|uniref:cysteine sulfinic acid decarboxylase-like n=2 Tax=Homarus americanus TaxID=6706 RepID=UPI001C457532|nr:cysteine sulfinic acid decarboxylase-like [Homarus americanus]